MLVTDVEIDECEDDQFARCPDESTFCLSSKNVTGSWRFTVGKCMSRFFVYFYMEDYQQSDISARLISDKGCDNIAETDYTKCANIPLSECGLESADPKGDDCERSCFRLECTYIDALKKNRTSLEACLPSFLQAERFNEICNNENSKHVANADYYNVQTKTPIAHYCSGRNSRRIPRSIEEAKSLSFWEIIVVLLALAASIFLLSIIWYRVMLARTGTPPFAPPHWMPSFVYPRPVETVIREEPAQELFNYRQI